MLTKPSKKSSEKARFHVLFSIGGNRGKESMFSYAFKERGNGERGKCRKRGSCQ
jgi:hypothetical protein